MKWSIRSRHKELKDLWSSYKESDRHASNTLPAAVDPRHPHHKLGMATSHQAAAEKAKRKGKKINTKVSQKLQKKSNDNYDMYLGHRSLASKYYNSYNNK